MPHALDCGPLYYAGTVEQRVGDLHAAFADTAIDGIVCTRGGWGSAELLPHLDAELVRANPKVFVGYSDHTALHVWLAREAGLVTFYGPMVAADFARAEGFDRASWGHALGGDAGWSLGASGWAARAARGSGRGDACGRMSFDSCRGAGHAVRDAAGERAGAANFVSRRHWDEAVPVGPDAAASALRGDAGACERDRLRRYAAVRRGGGGGAAGGCDPSCARGFCGADCDWAAVGACGWGRM